MDLDTENVVILGHGNVALDVARILLTPISVLKVGNSVSAQWILQVYFEDSLYRYIFYVHSIGLFCMYKVLSTGIYIPVPTRVSYSHVL